MTYQGEEFIKIGNARDFFARTKWLSPYEAKVLKIEIFDSRKKALMREMELHKIYSEYSYKPKYHFMGKSECFLSSIDIGKCEHDINSYKTIWFDIKVSGHVYYKLYFMRKLYQCTYSEIVEEILKRSKFSVEKELKFFAEYLDNDIEEPNKFIKKAKNTKNKFSQIIEILKS